MTKKWFGGFSLAMILILILTSCGNGNQEGYTIDKESFEPEMIRETSLGEIYLTYKDTEKKYDASSGPVELSVTGIQVGDLEVAAEHKGLFGKEKIVTIVTLTIESKNTSNDTILFHPNKSTLKTNAGDDVKSDTFFSDTIGGEYEGDVNTKGDVIFIVDSKASEVNQLNLHISEPKNAEDESIGEPIELTIDLN